MPENGFLSDKKSLIALLIIAVAIVAMYNDIGERNRLNEPNGLLVINAYARDGSLVQIPYIYATDVRGDPFKHSFEKDRTGRMVSPMSDTPMFVNVLWEVEGFGRLILSADNEGEGYRAEGPQGETVINLNYELAKSHLKGVADYHEVHVRSGYQYSSALLAEIGQARSYLDEARNATSETTRASLSDRSLNSSLWAGEKLTLETAKIDIEKYRKVNVTLKVVDAEGRPLENVTVSVRQTYNEVMFACGTRGFEMQESTGNFTLYKEKFKEVFNSGQVHFFWPMFEPQEGKYQWASRDEAVDWLRSNDLRIWGHLLIWLHEWSVPDWAKTKSYEELKGVLRNLCYGPVNRYRDSIQLWNVFNEPEWGNVLGLSVDQQIELLRLGLDATREANPEAVRMINPTIVWGEYSAWGMTAEGKAKRPLLTPYQFLEEVGKRGIEYEAVGLQFYTGSGGVGSGFTVRDMFTTSWLLDKYAELGKSIHLTELGVPSKFVDVGDKIVTGAGYWHRPWDEETQADWIEYFYTICYSKPYVDSISWFDLMDYPQVFIPYSGILNGDLSPKQSFFRLKQLLNSWTTTCEGATSPTGEYTCRGFKGEYEISVLKDGEVVARTTVLLNTDRTEIIRVNC